MDWQNCGGDQYTVDMESRYPLFSDVNANDFMNKAVKRQPAMMVSGIESRLVAEQQAVPAYMSCACKVCRQHGQPIPQCAVAREGMQGGREPITDEMYRNLEYMIVFLFVVIVVMSIVGLQFALSLVSKISHMTAPRS